MILQVLTNIETYLIEEDKRMIERDKHCKLFFLVLWKIAIDFFLLVPIVWMIYVYKMSTHPSYIFNNFLIS